MKNLIFLLLAFAIFSCSKPESESDICIDNILEIRGMEHYYGEMSGECKTYLRWFTDEDGGNFFMMDNPCADFALHLLDCDNVNLCTDSFDCQEIMADLTPQGIVGRE